MAYSSVYDRGTRFTNYSSIHSADAYVGDYQVMYTPGSTSPPVYRASRKASRFTKPPSATKNQNVSQSYLLPSNMPNTSQIVSDQGALPNIQIRSSIPADEKQIVASLRSLQKELAAALRTIHDLTHERDEAVQELRILRSNARRVSESPPKKSSAAQVEEELFDLSRFEDDSDKRHHVKQFMNKRVSIEKKQATLSDNARVLSPVQINVNDMKVTDTRQVEKNIKNTLPPEGRGAVEDTEEQSVLHGDPTAASNTSRRRRRLSLEENMTSAYILPDITEQQQQQQQQQQQRQQPGPEVSKRAQKVIHSLNPEHVASCEVCHRLTAKSKPLQKPAKRPSTSEGHSLPQQVATETKADYTRKLAGFLDESFVDDPTMRPKVSPDHALARVRALMNAQFLRAKERHEEAWLKYDAIEAPLSSRRHAQIGKELNHWAEKMEECRVHLDYLRDVEEGMANRE